MLCQARTHLELKHYGWAFIGNRYDTVDPNAVARSDNYYGWAKIAYENLGFMFATGKMHGGHQLENIQIRIGGPRETDVAGVEMGNLRALRRALGAYMSKRDLQQMVKYSQTFTTMYVCVRVGVPLGCGDCAVALDEINCCCVSTGDQMHRD